MKKLILIIIAVALNGCAYVINGDTQTINLKTSDNKKVKVLIANENMNETYTLPTKIELKKSSSDLIITVLKSDCITPTKTVIESKLDNWVWANVANLGLGLIRDAQGAMWNYDEVQTIQVQRDKKCIKKAKQLNQEMVNLHI